MIAPSENLYEVQRQLVLEFVCFFARFEFAMKTGGFLTGDERRAEADWDKLANHLKRDRKIPDEMTSAFGRAVGNLIKAKPMKQVVGKAGLDWAESSQGTDSREAYVLRLVRCVRNNLFHGGKFPYPAGPIEGSERHTSLLKDSIAILEGCLAAMPRLEARFLEAA